MPVQRPIPLWTRGCPGSAGANSATGTERVLRRVARMADGGFPSAGLQDGVEDVIARLHEYFRRESRDPSEVGIEGSVSLADRGLESWIKQALAWKEAGATHLTVNTAGAGFTALDQHVAAMKLFQHAWSDVEL